MRPAFNAILEVVNQYATAANRPGTTVNHSSSLTNGKSPAKAALHMRCKVSACGNTVPAHLARPWASAIKSVGKFSISRSPSKSSWASISTHTNRASGICAANCSKMGWYSRQVPHHCAHRQNTCMACPLAGGVNGGWFMCRMITVHPSPTVATAGITIAAWPDCPVLLCPVTRTT